MRVYKVVIKKSNNRYYYSVAGMPISYELREWTRACTDHYLYAYKNLDDAITLRKLLEAMYDKKAYRILECDAKDAILHALGGVWVFRNKSDDEEEIALSGYEYRCSAIKPLRVIKHCKA